MGLKLRSINNTSVYENHELKGFKNIKRLGGISNNRSNDNITILQFKHNITVLLTIIQCTNTTSVISKLKIFSTFSFLVILLSVLSGNLIVSGVNSSKKSCFKFKRQSFPYVILICTQNHSEYLI